MRVMTDGEVESELYGPRGKALYDWLYSRGMFDMATLLDLKYRKVQPWSVISVKMRTSWSVLMEMDKGLLRLGSQFFPNEYPEITENSEYNIHNGDAGKEAEEESAERILYDIATPRDLLRMRLRE